MRPPTCRGCGTAGLQAELKYRQVMAASLLLLLTLLLLLPRPGLGQQGPTDGELLLAFKATFTNGEAVLASWNSTEPCARVDTQGQSTWQGVFCRDGFATVV